MEFAAGVMVFPGGGVDDRDRNADIAWAGPPPDWWAQRFGIETDLAEALVCAAARETFEESGVLFAGPADDPDGIVGDASVYGDSRQRAGRSARCRSPISCAGKTWCCAPICCGRGRTGSPRRPSAPAATTPTSSWARCPKGQRADGENTESDRAGWTTPQDAIDDFEAGRNFLLPPTWTQLDSLAGRTVADVLAVERQIVPVQPHLEIRGDNWVFEFFDSDRYHAARKTGGMGWPLSVSEFVSVVVSDGSQDAGLAMLLLSRPPTNAMTRQVYREIVAAADELGRRDDVAAVILFGGHEIFSAGDDMPELRTLTPGGGRRRGPGPARGRRRRGGDPETDRRRDHRLRAGRRSDAGAGRRLAGQRRQREVRRDRDPGRPDSRWRRDGPPDPRGRGRAGPRSWCSAGASSTPRRPWRWA